MKLVSTILLIIIILPVFLLADSSITAKKLPAIRAELHNKLLDFKLNGRLHSQADQIMDDAYIVTNKIKDPMADIIRVPQDQPTIQAGIDAAVNGDTVLVADSTYYENIYFTGKAITVASYFIVDGDTNHINKTIIDGSRPVDPDRGSVVNFRFGEDTTSVLCGFTITGGTGTLYSVDYRVGGGIYCRNSGARIINNKIIGNKVNHDKDCDGAGIGVWPHLNASAEYLIIENNVIESNSLSSTGGTFLNGGGIAIVKGRITDNIIRYNSVSGQTDFAGGGGISAYCEDKGTRTFVIIKGNTITDNQTSASGEYGGYGAGVDVVFCNVHLLNNTISQNVTGGSYGIGAGIRLWKSKSASLIKDNIIAHNLVNAPGFGGGIVLMETEGVQIMENRLEANNGSQNGFGGGGIDEGYSSGTVIKDNTFIANKGSYGGAIFSWGSIILNNLITENEAGWGGGIYCYHYAEDPIPDLTQIINNTLTKNTADTAGGIAIVLTKAGVLNTICWGNTAAHGPEIGMWGGILHAAYSDIRFGADGIGVKMDPSVNWLTGNITIDPDFADADYRLSDQSLCLGAGRRSLNIGGQDYKAPDTDIEGNPRPAPPLSHPDMGAYENPFINPDIVRRVPEKYPTIQAAINAAVNGDVVLVKDSTYYENINFKGKAITVASHFFLDGDTSHIAKTIINGGRPQNPDSASVVSFVSGEDTNSVLYGLTITGGSGTIYIIPGTELKTYQGGGVYINPQSGARLGWNIIENNNIITNHGAFGAGISAGGPGSPGYIIIEHNEIVKNLLEQSSANLVPQGSGVFMGASGRIVANTISENICHAITVWAVGGGIRLWSGGDYPVSTVIVEDNTISRNQTISDTEQAYAGGINSSGTIVHMRSNIIADNMVKSANGSFGAGMHLGLQLEGTSRIENNIFRGNKNESGECWGGGIYMINSSPYIAKNLFSKNAASDGGALYLYDNCKPLLINNTIVDNQATGSGGGIYSQSAARLQIMNTILWNNQAVSDAQIYLAFDAADIIFSDIQGGWEGTGNIDQDPLFSDDSLYRLAANSPCIDAGHPAVDYNDRDGTRNDMGTYGGRPGMTWPSAPSVKYDYRYFDQPELNIGYVDSCAHFWLQSYDNQKGGFYTDVNRNGSPGGTNKNTLTQSRNAYGLARAFMMKGDTTYLKYADQALRFMYQHGWDTQHGGWFEQLDENGNPIDPQADKTAFFQHYALLGIAAYYEATRDSFHLAWLKKGLQHLQDKFWDDRPGYEGYYDRVKFDGSDPSGKSFNATVDAITTHGLAMYLMTGDEQYLTHLRKLAEQMISHLVMSMPAQKIGFVEMFDSDWNPDEGDKQTLMGHVLKTAWCLARIDQIDPDNSHLLTAEVVFKDVMDHGYDKKYGGPYDAFNRTTGEMQVWVDTAKAWWQMEQAILGGLQLYNLSGDNSYKNIARESSGFFMGNFVDREYDEVYASRDRYGRPFGGDDKGSPYKAGYHSIETGYYTYLYGMLFNGEHNQFDLHYRIVPVDSNRRIPLMPIALRPDAWPDWAVNIVGAFKDGDPYPYFSNDSLILDLAAGTGGDFTIRFEVVSGIEDLAAHIPDRNMLFQNYPNPFNPSTVISWQLAVSSYMELNIYNLLGQKVATLVAERRPAGFHQVQWDASRFASGVYYYQLGTDKGIVQSRKLVLIK